MSNPWPMTPPRNAMRPAEAATSPGGGSNNPNQESAVNEQHPNTASAVPTSDVSATAMDTIIQCCRDLNLRIHRARIFATEAGFALEEGMLAGAPAGPYSIERDRADALCLFVNEAEAGLREIETIFERLDIARMALANGRGA